MTTDTSRERGRDLEVIRALRPGNPQRNLTVIEHVVINKGFHRRMYLGDVRATIRAEK